MDEDLGCIPRLGGNPKPRVTLFLGLFCRLICPEGLRLSILRLNPFAEGNRLDSLMMLGLRVTALNPRVTEQLP